MKLATEDSFIKYVEVANGSEYLISDVLHFNASGGQDIANKIFPLIKDL
jgi:hypothetical protein